MVSLLPKRNAFDYEFIFGWNEYTNLKDIGFESREKGLTQDLKPFKFNGFDCDKIHIPLLKLPAIRLDLIEKTAEVKETKNILKITPPLLPLA